MLLFNCSERTLLRGTRAKDLILFVIGHIDPRNSMASISNGVCNVSESPPPQDMPFQVKMNTKLRTKKLVLFESLL